MRTRRSSAIASSATAARRASSKPRGGSRRRSARCRSTCSGPISCRRFTVKSPSRLCVATGENLTRLHNPAGHLLCYAVKLIRGEPKHTKQRGLYLENGLGATRVDTVHESELCLPAVFEP